MNLFLKTQPTVTESGRNGKMNKKIKSVIKTFPTQTIPGPNGFNGEIDQTSKEELIPAFLNLFQNQRGGTSAKHFFVSCILLIMCINYAHKNNKKSF